jgi:peptidoglycan/LPS O-acetylase OafA/YrhL
LEKARQEKGWIRSFDLVRASAILLVVFAHGRQLLPAGLRGDYWFAPAQWGIELFFALSGYLITGQAIKVAQSASKHSARNYFVRRFLRTIPLYWLIVLILGLASSRSAGEIGANALFLPSLPLAPHGPSGLIPVAWSLAIEEVSYLILGLAAILTKISLKGNQPSHEKVCNRLAMLHLLLIASMILARFYVCGHGFDFPQIKASGLLQLDALSYGGLAAIGMVHPAVRGWFSLTQGRSGSEKMLLLLLLLACLLGLTGFGWMLRFGFLLLATGQEQIGYTSILPQVVFAGHALSRCLCALLILLSALVPLGSWMGARGQGWKILVDMPAASSYSIYLVHLPILFWFRSLQLPIPSLPLFIAYLAASLGSGWIVYSLLEIPLLKLRRQFRDQPAALS